MDDVASIFERYQSIRSRLPRASFEGEPSCVGSLLDVKADVDAFVFDAFGVLNVGETPIPGAADRLNQLRAAGLAIAPLNGVFLVLRRKVFAPWAVDPRLIHSPRFRVPRWGRRGGTGRRHSQQHGVFGVCRGGRGV